MRSDEQGAMIRRLRFTGLRPQRKSNMTFFIIVGDVVKQKTVENGFKDVKMRWPNIKTDKNMSLYIIFH